MCARVSFSSEYTAVKKDQRGQPRMFFIFEFKIIKTVIENLNLKLRLSNMDLQPDLDLLEVRR